MKRWLSALMALVLTLLPVWACAQQMSEDEWAMVTAALASDENDPVPEKWRISVRDVRPAPNLDEKIVNILLLGTDSADMRENRGRADALLLFSVNVQTGDAKLVSLPETARTALPELPEAMRLKYLNCFGGPMLVMRQINQALGLNITRYCAVNFAGFEAAIDEMGGVWLPLTDRERVAVDIEDGVERLDGRQALRYVKLRWGEAVTDRPRKLLEALLRQVTVQGIDGAFSLMGALLPATDTNLTIANLTDLLFALLGQETPPSFETLALPSQQGMIPQDAAAWCRAVLYGR